MFILSIPLIGVVLEQPEYDVMAVPPERSRTALTRDVLLDIAFYATLLGTAMVSKVPLHTEHDLTHAL